MQEFHHHHHHMSVMELGQLLTRSGLTFLEVSSEVFHDSFCQLGNSVSLSWVVCREAFCLYLYSFYFLFAKPRSLVMMLIQNKVELP